MGDDVGAVAFGGCAVLVVEDQFLIADAMREAIEQLGGRVIGPVGTVDGALVLLRDDVPDAAVLDIDLGGERVDPVADALLFLGVPFAFTTGFDLGNVAPRFADALRLEKPVRMAVLARTLHALCERA